MYDNHWYFSLIEFHTEKHDVITHLHHTWPVYSGEEKKAKNFLDNVENDVVVVLVFVV